MAKTSRDVTAYIAAQPKSTQAALRRVRAAIRKALPDAEEIISYKIPAYRLHRRIVLFFAGWRAHYSLYPIHAHHLGALGDALAGYERSKGTLRFPLDEPVPVRLIARLAKLMAKEIAAKTKTKKTRKKRATR